jgi:ATP-dependent Clp protease ATP-binding subunit ClpA
VRTSQRSLSDRLSPTVLDTNMTELAKTGELVPVIGRDERE